MAQDVTGFITEANAMGSLVIASFGVLDVDRLTTFVRAAKATHRKLAVSPRQFYLLETLAAVIPLAQSGWPDPTDPDIVVFFPRKVSGDFHTTDYEPWSSAVWHDPTKRTTYEDVLANQQNYVVFFATNDLTTLVDLNLDRRGVFIYSRSEPHDPEMELTDQLWERWCDRFNFVRMNSQASGHASGLELREIIREIAPDMLFPIHTEDPDAFLTFQDSGTVPTVTVPLAGVAYELS